MRLDLDGLLWNTKHGQELDWQSSSSSDGETCGESDIVQGVLDKWERSRGGKSSEASQEAPTHVIMPSVQNMKQNPADVTQCTEPHNDPSALSDVDFNTILESQAPTNADAPQMTGDGVCTFARWYNSMGLKLLETGELVLSFKMLSRADDLLLQNSSDPERRKVHSLICNNLAIVSSRRKQHSLALKYLKRAASLDDENSLDCVDTQLNICATLSNLGRHREAATAALRALTLLQAKVSLQGDVLEVPEDMSISHVATMAAVAYHNHAVELEHLDLLTTNPDVLREYHLAAKIAMKHLGPDNPTARSLQSAYENAVKTAREKKRHEKLMGKRPPKSAYEILGLDPNAALNGKKKKKKHRSTPQFGVRPTASQVTDESIGLGVAVPRGKDSLKGRIGASGDSSGVSQHSSGSRIRPVSATVRSRRSGSSFGKPRPASATTRTGLDGSRGYNEKTRESTGRKRPVSASVVRSGSNSEMSNRVRPQSAGQGRGRKLIEGILSDIAKASDTHEPLITSAPEWMREILSEIQSPHEDQWKDYIDDIAQIGEKYPFLQVVVPRIAKTQSK